jgi:hypothetical protein
VRIPRAIESHVQLSAVACTLTQLLTLAPEHSDSRGLNDWTPMPWRKLGTPISLYEAQRLLRQASLPGHTYCDVGGQPPHAQKSDHPPSRTHRCARNLLDYRLVPRQS